MSHPLASRPDTPDQDLFHLDRELFAQPAAQQARRVGLLRAKTEALHSAERLVRVGRPLLFGTLAVSGVHLVHQFSLIKPATVDTLPIPDLVFHASTILTVLAIDAVAAFLVAVKSTSAYAGRMQPQRTQFFHLILTALVNLAFLLAYAPDLPAVVHDVLPILNLASAVMLGLLVPVSIVAVEAAHQVADAARLALLVEVTTLQGIVQAARNSQSAPARPEPASAPAPGQRTEVPPTRTSRMQAPPPHMHAMHSDAPQPAQPMHAPAPHAPAPTQRMHASSDRTPAAARHASTPEPQMHTPQVDAVQPELQMHAVQTDASQPASRMRTSQPQADAPAAQMHTAPPALRMHASAAHAVQTEQHAHASGPPASASRTHASAPTASARMHSTEAQTLCALVQREVGTMAASAAQPNGHAPTSPAAYYNGQNEHPAQAAAGARHTDASAPMHAASSAQMHASAPAVVQRTGQNGHPTQAAATARHTDAAALVHARHAVAADPPTIVPALQHTHAFPSMHAATDAPVRHNGQVPGSDTAYASQAPPPIRASAPADAEPEPAAPRACPRCGHALSRAQYAAAVRYGHCRACKSASNERTMRHETQ